jgi:hypothetical protein
MAGKVMKGRRSAGWMRGALERPLLSFMEQRRERKGPGRGARLAIDGSRLLHAKNEGIN